MWFSGKRSLLEIFCKITLIIQHIDSLSLKCTPIRTFLCNLCVTLMTIAVYHTQVKATIMYRCVIMFLFHNQILLHATIRARASSTWTTSPIPDMCHFHPNCGLPACIYSPQSPGFYNDAAAKANQYSFTCGRALTLRGKFYWLETTSADSCFTAPIPKPNLKDILLCVLIT